MATIPLLNPFETRVLPALPRFEAAAPADSQARLRLVLGLHADEQLEIWDDRIVAPDQEYTLDSLFDARVTSDWRAPLTVEPELGLALLDRRRRWNLYIPADEAQIWHAAYVLRAVCEARGIELEHLHDTAPQIHQWTSPIAVPDPVPMPLAASTPGASGMRAQPYVHSYAPPYTHPYAQPDSHPFRQPSAYALAEPDASLAGGLPARGNLTTPSDVVLMAIAHLSVLFMPALLPLAIWYSLRDSVPQVAEQAREALRFQLGVVVLALALLGYAGYEALRHGVAGAATTGLLGFVVVMAIAVVYAFFAATQAVRGHEFLYFSYFR